MLNRFWSRFWPAAAVKIETEASYEALHKSARSLIHESKNLIHILQYLERVRVREELAKPDKPG